jgi:hypothetical protein
MKKAAMSIENIIIAVLIASAIFGYVFMTTMSMADTLIDQGMIIDKDNYGAMINGNSTSIQHKLDQLNNTKTVSNRISQKFEELNPSFSIDGLTSVYTLAWDVIILIKDSIANFITMIDVTGLILGVDSSFITVFSTILIISFLISVMWLLLGRST